MLDFTNLDYALRFDHTADLNDADTKEQKFVYE